MADVPRPERFLQIGEAADRANLTQRTLRYYEEKGLLNPPTRMDGGFRLYSPDDIERIDRIKQLKELLGFSLAEIKEMLEAEDVRLQIKAGWRRDADAEEKAGRRAPPATSPSTSSRSSTRRWKRCHRSGRSSRNASIVTTRCSSASRKPRNRNPQRLSPEPLH